MYLVCQLNRKVTERGGEPQLSDLRGSGALEQDADVVIFVFRDTPMDKPGERNKSGPAKLIVGKHRGGPTGAAQANWIREFMQFIAVVGEPSDEYRAPDAKGPHWTERDQ
jgi:replicative DNA helicase